MKKIKTHTITGTIHCVSGMRIGGSDDVLQIGGTDLTCIKHRDTQKPYIPGSSHKGKLRSEMEQKLGQFGRTGDENGNEPCGCARRDCLICRIFGPHKNPRHTLGPTRIRVREGFVIKGGETELKTENAINRATGTAKDPRKVEIVLPGSEFRCKIDLDIWNIDQDCSYNGQISGMALVEFVKEAMRQVQNTGIGSGNSKGAGEIEYLNLKLDGEPFTL